MKKIPASFILEKNVSVSSPFQLEEKQIQKITSALEKRLNSEVVIDFDIDKNIDKTCSATATALAVAVTSKEILFFFIKFKSIFLLVIIVELLLLLIL